MKRKIITFALFAGLSLVAASCQKENVVEQSISAEMAYINVNYSIDGVEMHVSFDDEASWRAFLYRMIALAEEGHRVSFGENGHEYGVTKETVTFVTGSHSEATEWSNTMVKKGYRVTVDFDDKTKTYTCVAVK